jgi:hypothetical protein
MAAHMGKILIIIGICLVIVGLFAEYGIRIPFGRLPGDIKIQKENFTFYFPITSMILLSVLLTGIFWVIQKLR